MKLFTVNKEKKFIQFEEKEFREAKKEIDLETLLEENPEYFFDNSKLMIIGRQVYTNFKAIIDLLGVDEFGNTVVIELKRDKTPRETLAQLIEYAAFIDNLDYDQLNQIYQNYLANDEGVDLKDDHWEYYKSEMEGREISWNKKSKLVIVASNITPEIKQSAMYLRKKGLDVFCVEFKYFINNMNNEIISKDLVLGDEDFLRTEVTSGAQLPRIDKEMFMSALDDAGKAFFEKIFEFAEQQNLVIRWRTKGFSLNKLIKGEMIGLFEGYPPKSKYKQCIYVKINSLKKKVNDDIVNTYKQELKGLGKFETTGNNLQWHISKKNLPVNVLEGFFEVLKRMIISVEIEKSKED